MVSQARRGVNQAASDVASLLQRSPFRQDTEGQGWPAWIFLAHRTDHRLRLMKTLLIRVALAAVVLSGVVVATMLLRTAAFERDPIPEGGPYPFVFDELGAPERLAGALRIPTVSRGELADADLAVWLAFHKYLEEAFPRVHEALERETVSELSLLYRWPGTDPELSPVLLNAHMDVVSGAGDRTEGWRHPPFSGRIDGGYIWGRGAIDHKGSALGILEAVEGLLGAGFVPRRTILLAFGHDGESGGVNGARRIANLLEERGTQATWALGEGLYLVAGMIPGLADPVGMIGVAEKGGMNLRLIARAEGGSSSMPPRSTAAGVLSSAVARLEESAFPAEIRGPTLEVLETLGPYMDPGTRMLVANLWLLERPLARALTESPMLGASLRTTVAPTMLQAGSDGDKLPTEVSALVHLRIAPWDSPDSVVEQIRAVVSDLEIEVEVVEEGMGTTPPTAVYSSESEGFRAIRAAIHRTFPNVVAVVPGLAAPGTDTRHYGAVSESVYGFAPFRVDEETLHTIHGVGERVRMSAYIDVIRFYAELIRRGTE